MKKHFSISKELTLMDFERNIIIIGATISLNNCKHFNLDTTLPVIACPASYMYTLERASDTVVDYSSHPATATDTVGETTVTYDPAELIVNEEDVGKWKIVKAIATDTDGNTMSCNYMVIIEGKSYYVYFFSYVCLHTTSVVNY